LTAALSAAGGARADEYECGSLDNAYGPFDYRVVSKQHRAIVERYHFNHKVESLAGGQSSTAVGADIAYTLRAFPNHPRALLAMATLAEREKTDRPRGSEYRLACWFERALRFRPEDGQVHLVYGIVLMRRGKVDAGIESLQRALSFLGPDGNAYYNLGLAYFEKRDYATALDYAKKAYAAGFPLSGLKDKLKRAGKWVE
jgi:tetratricopeptide (TPR) repeat protein